MLDTHVEVGVITDFGGQVQFAISRQRQQFGALGFDLAAQGAAFAEQFQQAFTQSHASAFAQGKVGVQGAAQRGFYGDFGRPFEQTGSQCGF